MKSGEQYPKNEEAATFPGKVVLCTDQEASVISIDWISIIALITFVQLLFLTVVILTYKKGKRLSNLLLTGFMGSNALLIANALLPHNGWFAPASLAVTRNVGGSVYFLLMPFLYLYITSLCYNDFRLKTGHLMHVVPFIAFALAALLVRVLYVQSPDGLVALAQKKIPSGMTVGQIERLTHDIALHLQILSYLVASAVALARYRARLRELYSSIERIDLHWCNLLLIFFAVMWLLDLSGWVLRIAHCNTPTSSYLIFVSSLFVNLTFALMVTYKGRAQSASFSGIEAPSKYIASKLVSSDINEIVKKLSGVMDKNKPYLSPSLSIDDLSSSLRIPTRSLSQAIHLCFNRTFCDFINSYRIEEVKRRLCDERYANLTMVAVAFDTGFNSKSVFNAAFKKHTGMTPKEFKKKN